MRAEIRDMRERRATLVNNAREILERAEGEKRLMTADEEQQYKNIMKDVENLKKEIGQKEEVLRIEDEQRDLEASAGNPKRPGLDSPNGGNNPLASKEYLEAFNKFVMNGQISNSLQVTDDTAGGYITAPQQFVNELIKAIDDQVLIRQWARVETLNTSTSLGIPSLDSDPDDADWTAEIQEAKEDTSMKFGKRELEPQLLSKLIKVSMKLLRSSTMSPEQIVRMRMAYKFAVTMEKAYMTGDGNKKPLGVFTASNNGIPTSRDISDGNTTTAITFDGLKSAKFALKAGYRRNARWLLHRDTIAAVDKLKDNDGQYLWQPGTQLNEPDVLLGRPAFESEYAPNTFAAGNYVGIFGDFSYYWIADSLAFQVQRLNELYARTNQIGFIGRAESDGMPVLGEAFARVQLASS